MAERESIGSSTGTTEQQRLGPAFLLNITKVILNKDLHLYI